MVNKDANDYLQKGQYGVKQTLISERKEFMGSLRERVYLTARLEQLSQENALQAFQDEFQKHPDGQLLFNGTFGMSFFDDYIKESKRNNIPFTLIANEYAQTSPYAIIYTASTAVDEPTIDLAEKYPLTIKSEPQPKNQKKSFFKRFFS